MSSNLIRSPQKVAFSLKQLWNVYFLNNFFIFYHDMEQQNTRKLKCFLGTFSATPSLKLAFMELYRAFNALISEIIKAPISLD